MKKQIILTATMASLLLCVSSAMGQATESKPDVPTLKLHETSKDLAPPTKPKIKELDLREFEPKAGDTPEILKAKKELLREARKVERDKLMFGSSGYQLQNVLVPVSFFVFVLGIVFIVVMIRLKREKVRHETLRLMVEKGAEIPAELIQPKKSTSTTPPLLLWGLVLITFGIGVSLTAGIAAMKLAAWGSGFVFLFPGLGLLLAWHLGKKQSTPQTKND